jgi:hypothetical protein
MVLGLWLRLSRIWMLLVAIEFIKSNAELMVLLNATKHDWLHEDSLNKKVSTTQKPSVLLLNQPLFG